MYGKGVLYGGCAQFRNALACNRDAAGVHDPAFDHEPKKVAEREGWLRFRLALRGFRFTQASLADSRRTQGSHPVYKSGGERGIRTPGGLRLTGFQDRSHKPLDHLSLRKKAKCIDYLQSNASYK